MVSREPTTSGRRGMNGRLTWLLAMLAPLLMAGSCTSDAMNAMRSGVMSFTTATVVDLLSNALPVDDWLANP